jgi:hypothetical protein
MTSHWNKPRPECEAISKAVLAYLSERGLTVMQFSEMIYGRRGPNNSVAGVGNVYPVAHGAQIPTDTKLALWKEKTGIDLYALAAEARANAPGGGKPGRKPGQAMTPVRAAVAAHKRATAAAPSAAPIEPRADPPRRVQPPLFAMSIDQDGRSNVTLNLVDVSAEEALRAMATLAAANLIKAKP